MIALSPRRCAEGAGDRGIAAVLRRTGAEATRQGRARADVRALTRPRSGALTGGGRDRSPGSRLGATDSRRRSAAPGDGSGGAAGKGQIRCILRSRPRCEAANNGHAPGWR